MLTGARSDIETVYMLSLNKHFKATELFIIINCILVITVNLTNQNGAYPDVKTIILTGYS